MSTNTLLEAPNVKKYMGDRDEVGELMTLHFRANYRRFEFHWHSGENGIHFDVRRVCGPRTPNCVQSRLEQAAISPQSAAPH